LRTQRPSQRFGTMRGRDGQHETVVFRLPNGESTHLDAHRDGHRDGEVVARYFGARPWYERGSVAGRYLAQLDEAGTTVTVFSRGVTRDVPPDIGRPLTSP
jgi:hypothetical protein